MMCPNAKPLFYDWNGSDRKKGSSTILSRTSIINGNFFDDVHFLSQFFPKCNT